METSGVDQKVVAQCTGNQLVEEMAYFKQQFGYSGLSADGMKHG